VLIPSRTYRLICISPHHKRGCLQMPAKVIFAGRPSRSAGRPAPPCIPTYIAICFVIPSSYNSI
jgi:hypothetical protein